MRGRVGDVEAERGRGIAQGVVSGGFLGAGGAGECGEGEDRGAGHGRKGMETGRAAVHWSAMNQDDAIARLGARLEKLEEAGLISRHMHPADRRKVEVELTAAGMALVDEVTGDLMVNESKLLDVLDLAEQDQLRGLLKKLLGTFE